MKIKYFGTTRILFSRKMLLILHILTVELFLDIFVPGELFSKTFHSNFIVRHNPDRILHFVLLQIWNTKTKLS